MSKYLIRLDEKRPSRYALKGLLWSNRKKNYASNVDILLDTGAFNTTISKNLAANYATPTAKQVTVKIGGFSGKVPVCIIHKLKIGNFVMENVAALSISFDSSELQDHILIGANILNNWRFTLCRHDNEMEVSEKILPSAPTKFPYRYYHNSKGEIIALQITEAEEENHGID
ncbi:MAG: retroviral-like aspartic protease family protein [Turicibacter sp.]|nr:retroviral-like aspartic protease family protein [Turicibacter sp.]